MADVETIDPDAVLWSTPVGQRQGRPLLVLLHGYGSDEADLYGLVPFLPPEPVVASVRAPISEGPGFAWFPRDTNNPGMSVDSSVEVAVRAVLGWLDSLPPPPSVGLLEFSQGGAMALQLMCYEPLRFAYVVQLSGFVVGGVQPGDAALAVLRPHVFWGRGSQDSVISSLLIERTTAWLPTHSTLDARIYDGTRHSIAEQELTDVATFITAHL